MITTSTKLPNENPTPEDCQDCNGVGRVLMVSRTTNDAPFETVCGYCCGEKRITPELIERKKRGRELHDLRLDKRLEIRDVSIEFRCLLSDWSDAESGRATMEQIERKFEFLKNM
jgi:hypothetical protein